MQHTGGYDWADTAKFHQSGSAGQHHAFEFLGQRLDLVLDADQLGQLLGGKPASGLAGQVPGPHASQACLGLQRGEVLLALTRPQF
jgi:hypothetical protein